MKRLPQPTAVCATVLVTASAVFAGVEPLSGSWRAWLECPGGELPFGLDLRREGDGWQAWIVNGEERIAIPRATVAEGRVVLDVDYYDSKIEANVGGDGSRLDGKWTKRAAGGGWTSMAFHATAGESWRFGRVDGVGALTAAPTPSIAPRWAVRFSKSDDLAVGLFSSQPTGLAAGTFLTATGDYRYLAGDFDGRRLRLSCFDGAHAFLFDARMQSDDTLAGDFWSRDSWHETWTAKPDASASLPDAFHMTRWSGNARLGDLTFPDLDGKPRSLNDPAFVGGARIIVVFGSWCPNCHDETAYLVELHHKYRDRGLRVVGLAFELTGDLARDTKQVRTYAERNGLTYPVLIAGVSDKDQASLAVPILDRVRAYPTTIFADASGTIRAVHTGFSGPATGAEHKKLRAAFERLIGEMLSGSADQP